MPIHVHVGNADGEAKFNVEALELIKNYGLKNKDVKLAEAIIAENQELIIDRWNEYFNTR